MAFFLFGVGSGQAEEMKQANLTSQIGSDNQTFTLPENYKAGSLRLFYNGIRQVSGENFAEHNSTQFITTGFTAVTGDFITVDYIAQ